MKCRRVVTVVLSCAFPLSSWALPAAQQHRHDSSAVTVAAVPAQRWTPDAPLREGMRRAHAAVDELRHYEMGHMSAPMAVDRAVSVEHAVIFMFANCKLTAEPDAALHGILVPLLEAAQALTADPGKRDAVARMREAIAHYPQYFDDPGWDSAAPVTHETHDES